MRHPRNGSSVLCATLPVQEVTRHHALLLTLMACTGHTIQTLRALSSGSIC